MISLSTGEKPVEETLQGEKTSAQRIKEQQIETMTPLLIPSFVQFFSLQMPFLLHSSFAPVHVMSDPF